MGWWTTEGDSIIVGDESTDVVTTTLLNIVELQSQKGKAKLTLQDLLNSILLALRIKPEVFINNDETAITKLIAKVEPGNQKFTSSESSSIDDRIVELLSDAFEEIAVSYEDSELERKPNLSELLANIAFVLGYSPDEYLSLPQDISITGIFVE